METIFAVGRGWMESILSERTAEERAPWTADREACGHPQQLEGYRPKQVLTLVGKVTFKRAYYRCVRGKRRTSSRRRRTEPAASMYAWRSACGWALGTARSTDECGSAASRELSVRILDTGRSRGNLQSAAPLTDVSAPSAQLDAAAGRSPAAAGR